MPSCSNESLSSIIDCPNETMEESTELRNFCATAGGSSIASPEFTPGSPLSTSPPVSSPVNTLGRRSCLKRTWSSNSTNSLIQEPFIIQSDVRTLRSTQTATQTNLVRCDSVLVRIIGWYPFFLLRIIQVILVTISQITLARILLALPTLWFHLWVICFWKLIQFPLLILRSMLTVLFSTKSSKQFKTKTVLISGGSTMQALHLARNFYSAGANVIVCEIEGVFCFTRFSTAVSKFYTVPRPGTDGYKSYIKTIVQIVKKENVNIYVPVAATNTAYYDALAKPYLELLGCTCFCPGVKEVAMLDDILELMHRCQNNRIPTPQYYEITDRTEVMHLYDEGVLGTGNFIMHKAGIHGIQEKVKYELPPNKNDFKLNHEISSDHPWVIVKNDVVGKQYLTCTTVKDSHVIANVTCELAGPKRLMPVENPEITSWVKNYIRRLRSLRPITAHLSFRFVVNESSQVIVPLGCRVGVSISYICHTSLHSQAISRPPCRHYRSSGALSIPDKSDKFLDGVDQRCNDVIPDRIFNTIIDKRDALFVFWDPLPYCVHYHMQLPLRNIVGLVQQQGGEADNHHEHFTRTFAASVH